MAASKPTIRLKAGETYPQLGVMAEVGYVQTQHQIKCWSCGEPTNKRKPGTVQDVWKCDACDVIWSEPAVGT